jgi:hypothetical protein
MKASIPRLLLIIFVLFATSIIFCQSPSDYIRAQIESGAFKSPQSYSFKSSETVTEYADEDLTEVKGRSVAKRLYTICGKDSTNVETLESITEGDFSLDRGDEEKDKKGKKGKKGNDKESIMSLDDEDSPFSLEGMKKFIYRDKGFGNFLGKRVRKIEFEPCENDEGLIGTAIFSEDDRLIRVELLLTKKPAGLKRFDMYYSFTTIDDYLVPSGFGMSIAFKMFIIKKVFMKIETRFTEFSIK